MGQDSYTRISWHILTLYNNTPKMISRYTEVIKTAGLAFQLGLINV